LRYEAGTGGWQGEGDLLNADLAVEGLPAKVHLDSARVRMEGAKFSLSRIAGRVDDIDLRGEFQYDPAAAIQSQLQVQLGDVSLEALSGWLSSATERERGVVSRTLGLSGGAAPDWVAARRLAAQIQMKSLRSGDQVLPGPIAARVAWSKGVFQLVSLTGPGRLRGEGQVVLAGEGLPGKFTVESLPWHSGVADAVFDLDTVGSVRQGKFTVNARDLTLLEGRRWMHLLIEGEFDARGTRPNLTFNRIEIHPRPGDDASTLKGSGQSLANGSWEWTLEGQGKSRKITGPVFDGFWKENP
jgi:hypothetical protein